MSKFVIAYSARGTGAGVGACAPENSKRSGENVTTRTCPRSPTAPMLLPLNSTLSPPAFPVVSLAVVASIERLSLGCSIPLKTGLPSATTETQVGSVAVSRKTKWPVPGSAGGETATFGAALCAELFEVTTAGRGIGGAGASTCFSITLLTTELAAARTIVQLFDTA